MAMQYHPSGAGRSRSHFIDSDKLFVDHHLFEEAMTIAFQWGGKGLPMLPRPSGGLWADPWKGVPASCRLGVRDDPYGTVWLCYRCHRSSS